MRGVPRSGERGLADALGLLGQRARLHEIVGQQELRQRERMRSPLALRVLDGASSSEQAFASAIEALPLWLLFTLMLLAPAFRRHRTELDSKP